MVTHLNLGGEVLVLDDTSLLCERCKAILVAAKEATAAVQRLREMTGQKGLPALPAPKEEEHPWAGVPGKKLSREARVAKAKHLLGAREKPAKAPKPEHRTLNGTQVTAPHLLLPRKKITARAEADIERVVAGKMKAADWVKRHGYSGALLRKRLEMRGAVDPHRRTRDGYNLVPGYVPPSGKLSENEIKQILAGEISVRHVSTKHGIPTGTVYRLVADYRKGTPRTQSQQPARGVEISDADLKAVVDGQLSLGGLADKYKMHRPTVHYRVKKYCERYGIEWPLTREGDDENLELPHVDDGEADPRDESTPAILDELKNLQE